MGNASGKSRAAKSERPEPAYVAWVPENAGQDVPALPRSDSPRLAGGSAGDGGELLQLREAVGKSVTNLETRLQQSTEGASLAEAGEWTELKVALSAAEEGVQRVQTETAREVARSQDLRRQSASEATVLRLRLEKQASAMREVKGEVASLRQANEELRTKVAEFVVEQSRELKELQTKHLPTFTTSAPQQQYQKPYQRSGADDPCASGEDGVEELREQLAAAHKREELFMQLLLRELRARALEGHGAVPIIARIRRATEEEEARRAVVAVEAVGEGSVMVRPPGSAEKIYRFDRVLSQRDGQDAVCREVLGLIEAAVDGSSAAVLVYGGSNSGREHTILGTPEEPGLLMLALGEVFNLREERAGLLQSHIGISMLQIWEDLVWDLLGPDGYSPGAAGDQVQPVFVDDLGDAVRVLDEGVAELPATSYDNPGGFSILYTIFVTTKNRISGEEASGKLQITHLSASSQAGSLATPPSVLHLGDCLVASLKGQRQTWDANVLTLLLRDSLAPPSPKAAVLIAMSPCAEHAADSVAALNFGARCFAATSRGQLARPASVADTLMQQRAPRVLGRSGSSNHRSSDGTAPPPSDEHPRTRGSDGDSDPRVRT